MKLINLLVYNILYILITICTCNFIKLENELLGSKDWFIPQPQTTNYPSILGFTTKFSCLPGDQLDIKLHSNNNHTISLYIYRLGYYNGLGARLIDILTITLDSLLSKGFSLQQSNCLFDETNRLVDCDNWFTSYSWILPNNLTTGVYVILPKDSTGEIGGYIPFVVRQLVNYNDISKYPIADIAFKTSDTTWVAYNKFGSYNVYRGNGSIGFDSRAYRVSYNRPLINRLLKHKGQYENFIFGAEYPLIYWLEKQGYSVTYLSTYDVESIHSLNLFNNNPNLFKVLLSVGHDEYWTQSLIRAYTDARNNGINLMYLSGNEMFWSIRWSDDKLTGLSTNPIDVKTDHGTLTKGQIVRKIFDSKIGRNNQTNRWFEPRVIVCYKETIDLPNNIKIYLSDYLTNNRSKYLNNSISDYPTYYLSNYLSDHLTNSLSKYQTNNVTNYLRSKDLSNHWTGTFVDTRYPTIYQPEYLPNSLSSQLFAVNGFRNDSIHIHSYDLKLRFWRNVQLATNETNEIIGLLGYEFDIFSDDCYRPIGFIGLSNTRIHISNQMIESYGASYHGSGSVLHKLSMYRHTDLNRNVTSLVFAAGTIQLSYQLSSFHDGPYMSTYLPIQQALVNILADMNTQPSSLSNDLQISKKSLDTSPPSSSIIYPTNNQIIKCNKNFIKKFNRLNDSLTIYMKSYLNNYLSNCTANYLSINLMDKLISQLSYNLTKLLTNYPSINSFGHVRVHGQANDIDGQVATIEISFDNGISYNYINMKGLNSFHYRYNIFNNQNKDCSKIKRTANQEIFYFLLSYLSNHSYMRSIHITTRAVDDSGWIESINNSNSKNHTTIHFLCP